MPPKDVLQPVDDAVRRHAKTLVRTARFGALAVSDPERRMPMASRVSLATASDGAPVFLISQLSGHFGALERDGRSSILVGEPGRGDPLAHPRLTVFGRAAKVEGDERARLRARFLARHPKAALYVDFTDFAFWRLAVEGASFNAGFGKAYEMAPEDLLAPTDPALEEMEAGAVEHMNE
ncbi:MAG: pyridoxamine 5'-phosphate oxidase family protein, partial [Pseudomonadota bacterium]